MTDTNIDYRLLNHVNALKVLKALVSDDVPSRGLRIVEIVEKSGVCYSTVTRILRWLLVDKLTERNPVPDDPRRKFHKATFQGREQYKKVQNVRSSASTDLKKKYEKGASIRSLAESTGRSYGATRRALTQAGVRLRGRGGNNRAT
jgi:DNA-binding MarR family transcriptional regulator